MKDTFSYVSIGTQQTKVEAEILIRILWLQRCTLEPRLRNSATKRERQSLSPFQILANCQRIILTSSSVDDNF